MRRLIRLLLLFVTISGSTAGMASRPPDSGTVELRILSWNIYCLPAKAIGNPGATKRAPHIGRILSAEEYDVIVFQEAFHPEAREKILQELGPKFPHRIGPVTSGTVFKTNDGIWILSRWPMRFIGSTLFDRSLLPDWFSRRGATLVEIEKLGFPFFVLGTHLQSGAGGRRDAIRIHQARHIARELIDPYSREGVPLFVCGDFNTSNLETIGPMLALFGCDRYPIRGEQTHTWPMPGHGRTKKYLDHVWLRSNDLPPSRMECIIRSFSHPYRLRGRTLTSLSDHFAVEAQAEWRMGGNPSRAPRETGSASNP